jgi:hypothetical protein
MFSCAPFQEEKLPVNHFFFPALTQAAGTGTDDAHRSGGKATICCPLAITKERDYGGGQPDPDVHGFILGEKHPGCDRIFVSFGGKIW